MSEIVRLVLPFFGLIFLGFGAGRLRGIPPGGLAGLEFFVLYLAMPALLFKLIAEAPAAAPAMWPFVLTTTFATYCAFAIAFSIGALVNGGNVPEATVQGLVGSYANIGYMAPAVAIAAFGSAAAVPMALVFSFDNAMLFTLTPLMMALGGAGRVDPLALTERIARQVLLHPFIIATAAGLLALWLAVDIPAPVDAFLSLLGGAAAPAALFAVGVGLAMRPVGQVHSEMPVLVGVKLVVHPLIVYLLLSWVGGFDAVWVHTAVLIAALPPAANVLVLAHRHRAYVERATTSILLGAVVSVATVTVVLILLLNDLLPADPFR